LSSSKTRAELLALHKELDLDTPFICENGAAVYWQDKLTPSHKTAQWKCHEFASQRAKLIAVLQQLREKHHYNFTGFADCSVNQLVELTSLNHEQAALAATREYTEPLLWHDTEKRFLAFVARLNEHGLRAIQGGRFISVMGEFDKASAMQWLIKRYQQQNPLQNWTTVALGDSPNDEAMLQAASIAVVIQSARSHELNINKPKRVIRTLLPGPAGWQTAMADILQDHSR
jgi:mannosyl-3-phosphoglycerate phosphatase